MKSTDKIIEIVRSLKEEIANVVGGGHIAGTAEAGDDPPVRLRKRKRETPVGRYGSRRMWLKNLKPK